MGTNKTGETKIRWSTQRVLEKGLPQAHVSKLDELVTGVNTSCSSAVLCGSWAEGTSSSQSDIDLLFISKDETDKKATMSALKDILSVTNDSIYDCEASHVRNLVYYNKYFLRMEYDDGYISKYLSHMHAQEQDAVSMKKYMILMGLAMIASAPLTGGTSVIWGLDMIVSTTSGKSMFDHILHGAMEALGVDKNYIGNFSIWGITSNQGWNLILTEALAGGISFGVSTAAKGVSRLGGRLLQRSTRLASSPLTRFMGLASNSVDDVLRGGFRKAMKSISDIGVHGLVWKGVKEYFELVGEVIFEMAFDSVLRFDKGERPAGGGEAFFTAMTLSILTSALMKAMGKRGIKTVAGADGAPTVKAHKARLILPTIALALQLAMFAMRIPVLVGNMG